MCSALLFSLFITQYEPPLTVLLALEFKLKRKVKKKIPVKFLITMLRPKQPPTADNFKSKRQMMENTGLKLNEML